MKEAVGASRERLTSFKFVCRGSVPNRRRERIAESARSLGITHVTIWSGTEFEEYLRRDAQSLVMRFVEGIEFPDAEEALRRFVEVTSADKPAPAELLSSYQNAFARLYEPVAADFVPVSCKAGDRPITSLEVLAQLIDSKQSTLLRGPSGFGKSMLAAQIGLGFVAKKGVVILLQGKEVSGPLHEALDREVRLLGARSCAELFAAARNEGRATLVIVDGYNECTGIDKLTLTRSLAQLAIDRGSCLLVT